MARPPSIFAAARRLNHKFHSRAPKWFVAAGVSGDHNIIVYASNTDLARKFIPDKYYGYEVRIAHMGHPEPALASNKALWMRV